MSRRYDSPAIDPLWRKARDKARTWVSGSASADAEDGWSRKVRKYSRNARARFLMIRFYKGANHVFF